MNFLNEVVMAYPEAISFGPGRPLESLFDVRSALAHVEAYAAAVAGSTVADKICTPMRYFTSTQRWRNVIRLAFSCVAPQDIEQGIASLARFVAARRNR